MEREAWIIDAVRSPRGKGKDTGALHNVHPQRILAQVLNGLKDRVGFDTASVDDVIMGCGAGSGDHSMDIARMSALDAGWALEAPGVTLNRFCGSGQQAVNFAAMGVLSGMQDIVVAGGIESMSRPSPMHVDGFTANNNHLRDQYNMVPQGISADLIATVEGFTREQCDALAVESQRRAAIAIAEGRFERSLSVLQKAKRLGRDIFGDDFKTKSGLMLGLGENRQELIEVFQKLRSVGVDILTLGQYLRPTRYQLPVARYVPPEEFESLAKTAKDLGFLTVYAGPLVRSSFNAFEVSQQDGIAIL